MSGRRVTLLCVCGTRLDVLTAGTAQIPLGPLGSVRVPTLDFSTGQTRDVARVGEPVDGRLDLDAVRAARATSPYGPSGSGYGTVEYRCRCGRHWVWRREVLHEAATRALARGSRSVDAETDVSVIARASRGRHA
jgi:hypothetical protein